MSGELDCHYAVVEGFPGEEILNYSLKNGVDMIVMSTHGGTAIGHFFFGSVTDKVVRRSTVPVMTIPAGKP